MLEPILSLFPAHTHPLTLVSDPESHSLDELRYLLEGIEVSGR